MTKKQRGHRARPSKQDRWVYRKFQNIVQIIASSPAATVRAFPKGAAVVSEIIGDFTFSTAFTEIFEREVDEKARKLIKRMHIELKRICSRRDFALWNDKLVSNHSAWGELRKQAQDLLAHMKWPMLKNPKSL